VTFFRKGRALGKKERNHKKKPQRGKYIRFEDNKPGANSIIWENQLCFVAG